MLVKIDKLRNWCQHRQTQTVHQKARDNWAIAFLLYIWNIFQEKL